MADIEFYNVKTRSKVLIPESRIQKTKFERQGKNGQVQVRYAVKAEHEGTKLTKFVSKDAWDKITAPEVKS